MKEIKNFQTSNSQSWRQKASEMSEEHQSFWHSPPIWYDLPPKSGMMKRATIRSFLVPREKLQKFAPKLKGMQLSWLLWQWDYLAGGLVDEIERKQEEKKTSLRGFPQVWNRITWADVLGPDAGEEGQLILDSALRSTGEEEKVHNSLFATSKQGSNGYKVSDYIDEFRKTLAMAFMAIFRPHRTTYIMGWVITFIERVLAGAKVDWALTFHRYSQKLVEDLGRPVPVYLSGFLVHLYRAHGLLTRAEQLKYPVGRHEVDSGSSDNEEKEKRVQQPPSDEGEAEATAPSGAESGHGNDEVVRSSSSSRAKKDAGKQRAKKRRRPANSEGRKRPRTSKSTKVITAHQEVREKFEQQSAGKELEVANRVQMPTTEIAGRIRSDEGKKPCDGVLGALMNEVLPVFEVLEEIRRRLHPEGVGPESFVTLVKGLYERGMKDVDVAKVIQERDLARKIASDSEWTKKWQQRRNADLEEENFILRIKVKTSQEAVRVAEARWKQEQEAVTNIQMMCDKLKEEKDMLKDQLSVAKSTSTELEAELSEEKKKLEEVFAGCEHTLKTYVADAMDGEKLARLEEVSAKLAEVGDTNESRMRYLAFSQQVLREIDGAKENLVFEIERGLRRLRKTTSRVEELKEDGDVTEAGVKGEDIRPQRLS